MIISTEKIRKIGLNLLIVRISELQKNLILKKIDLYRSVDNKMLHRFVTKLVTPCKSLTLKRVQSNKIVVELTKLLNAKLHVMKIIAQKLKKKYLFHILIVMPVIIVITLMLTMEYFRKEMLKETVH